jgi:hypothetical protein
MQIFYMVEKSACAESIMCSAFEPEWFMLPATFQRVEYHLPGRYRLPA